MFDFVNYLASFVDKLPAKDKMIMQYLNGTITKEQLDEFMKGQKND